MKNIVLILLFFFSSFGFSQTLINGNLDHDTVLNKKFSIVFYITLDSNYTVASSTSSTLALIIDTLNSRFARIGVTFENCSTVIIPNFVYGHWKKAITEPVVTASWYLRNTLNFYIVDSIKGPPPDYWSCYSYPPPTSSPPPPTVKKDIIVIERLQLLIQGYAPLFHAMGHFFGLSHTDMEIGTGPAASPGPPSGVTSQEYANGSNGNVHGDCIADTEADPASGSAYHDGNGDRYIPPIDNFMSIYSTGCRYTQQQYNFMARTIAKSRLYLH